jgi:prepilin-type N-terminal cleavage/methylation domain-containing protein
MNKQKGFTIIELIVVIAIIAVLTAIVLVNVTSYINKAKDAKINSNLANMATGMASCYASTSTYVGCFANTAYIPAALGTDISTANGGTAAFNTEAAGTFVICAKLASDGTKGTCVDSTGVTKNNVTYSGCAGSITACP